MESINAAYAACFTAQRHANRLAARTGRMKGERERLEKRSVWSGRRDERGADEVRSSEQCSVQHRQIGDNLCTKQSVAVLRYEYATLPGPSERALSSLPFLCSLQTVADGAAAGSPSLACHAVCQCQQRVPLRWRTKTGSRGEWLPRRRESPTALPLDKASSRLRPRLATLAGSRWLPLSWWSGI